MTSDCASSSLAFRMMYSAYKLNKQSDSIQPWRTPFPIWKQSNSNCCFLTCIQISQEAGLIFWSLKNFPQLLWSTQSFDVINKADVFLEFSCFFYNPTDTGNLISGSSAFSKSNLNIWNFMVHVLLKTGLENFPHYLASMWDECTCTVVWTFLALPFLGIGMKT